MADTFKPPPLSAHEGPAQGFVPPPPVEDKPNVPLGDQPATIGAVARTMGDQALEGAKGIAKGIGRSVYNAGSSAINPLGTNPVANYLDSKTGISKKVHDLTEPSNTAQTVGSYLPDAAMMLMPGGVAEEGAKLLPNTASAANKFRAVARAANNVPLDLTKASAPALEAHELGETGSAVPKVLGKFLKRATSPDEPPMTFETGRRFATNAGRLSTKESLATNPPMKAQVSEFARAIADANKEAAAKVGMGDVYESAINEYRRAKTLGNVGDKAMQIAKKYMLPAAAAGAGGAAGVKAVRMLGE